MCENTKKCTQVTSTHLLTNKKQSQKIRRKSKLRILSLKSQFFKPGEALQGMVLSVDVRAQGELPEAGDGHRSDFRFQVERGVAKWCGKQLWSHEWSGGCPGRLGLIFSTGFIIKDVERYFVLITFALVLLLE